jgi:hypothetical protein
VLSDNHLIFSTQLCHIKLHIKLEFGFDPLVFDEFIALGLRKSSGIISVSYFFLSAYRYSFDIWYIELSYQVTDQVGI